MSFTRIWILLLLIVCSAGSSRASNLLQKNAAGSFLYKAPLPGDPEKDTLYIPTAFSPNDDHINEVFRVFSTAPLENFRFSVFNQWGIKLFETTDISAGWDGTYNVGDGIYKVPVCPPGDYVYIIKYKYFFHVEQQTTGHFRLIR